MMANDPAIRRYLYDLGSRRNNNGIVPHESIQFTYQSVKQFLAYIDVPVSDHAISDLVNYKRQNPLSDDIELALADYSRVPPIKYHAGSANRILGVFGASGKRARLDVRINNHFTPSAENCAIETFREIYSHLTPYQQDMVQWGVYVPERAKAASRTPFADIDLSRSDYAVVHMHGSAPSALGIRTKARVDHPAFVPIDFARKLVTRAQAAGRRCPFPDHQSEWKKITTFARKEYSVLLQSKYCRKFFEDMAEETSLPPSIAAFIMGDKTKLAQTGHLPQHYNLKIRFIENMISRYKLSGLDSLLWLGRPQQTSLTEIDKLREENARFKAALRQKEEP